MAIKVSDELLMSYADGELPREEAAALEALLAQDAGLRARLEPFAETRRQLSVLFAHRLHEPVPDRLIAAIARTPVAARISPVQPTLVARVRAFFDTLDVTRFGMTSLPAYAASLVALFCVGATMGWLVGRTDVPPAGLIEAAGSRLVASGALAATLESKRSRTAVSVQAVGVTIVPTLTFHSHEDGICRAYRIKGATGAGFAGIACRAPDGTWNVPLHVAVKGSAGPSGDYQTAGDQSVPAVEAAVGTLIEGDALGPEDEAALIRNGWSAPGGGKR
jgi:anti-sigma factor RsiW